MQSSWADVTRLFAVARCLLDTNSQVREAARRLEPLVAGLSGATLLAMLDAVRGPQTVRPVVRLLVAKGKWASLPWLLALVNSPQPGASYLAREAVTAWFSPSACNTVFTRPSHADEQAIDTALKALRDTGLAWQVREWLAR